MEFYPSEEICAPMTWVTLAGDVNNEVMVYTKVKKPSSDDIYDMFKDCIETATDERIRKLGTNGFIAHGHCSYIAYNLARSPWELKCNCEGFYLLYKLWYDCVTLRMGVKPQVTVYSEFKPRGMPNHWVYVHTPKDIIVIDDDRDAPIPVAEVQPVQPVQVQPAQQLPWYHPNWVPEVPYWNQPTRRSTRAHSGGVQKLSYDNQGQCESNSVIARAVWESLNE